MRKIYCWYIGLACVGVALCRLRITLHTVILKRILDSHGLNLVKLQNREAVNRNVHLYHLLLQVTPTKIVMLLEKNSLDFSHHASCSAAEETEQEDVMLSVSHHILFRAGDAY